MKLILIQGAVEPAAEGRGAGIVGRGRSGMRLRRLARGLLGLVVVAGVAACGEGEAAIRDSSLSESALAGCASRVVEHRYGHARVGAAPQRVVSLSYRDQDALLALGETPVAVQDGDYGLPYLEWPWVEARLTGERPRVLAAGEVNFEEVASLSPDAVLAAGSGLTVDEHGILSRLAPTVAPPAGYVDYGVPWQDNLRMAGRLLCLEDEAAARIDEVESRVRATRERYPQLAGASAVVAMAGGPGGAFWAFGPEDSRSRFLEALGMRTPDVVARLAGDRFVATVSAERMDLLDVDFLLWIATPRQRAKLEADPLYRRLAVVREGRVLYVDPDDVMSAALTNTTALSLPYLLEELAPRIASLLAPSAAE